MELKRLARMILQRRWKDLRWSLKVRLAKATDKPHEWELENPADILIVGAAKCGTTSLHEYLAQHPRIHATRIKEHHYYDETVLEVQEKGWTRKLWKARVKMESELVKDYEDQLSLESTPNYLWSPETAWLSFRDKPDRKIIVLLRNPVDRVRSNFWMYKRAGQEQRTWSEFQLKGVTPWLLGQPYGDIHLRHGRYASQLKPWLDLYGKENVRVYWLEDMQNDPARVVRRVLQWLGLGTGPVDSMKFPVLNKGWGEPPGDWNKEARDALEAYYAPEMLALQAMGYHPPWKENGETRGDPAGFIVEPA